MLESLFNKVRGGGEFRPAFLLESVSNAGVSL